MTAIQLLRIFLLKSEFLKVNLANFLVHKTFQSLEEKVTGFLHTHSHGFDIKTEFLKAMT